MVIGPDFDIPSLRRILSGFGQRKRRFGGLVEAQQDREEARGSSSITSTTGSLSSYSNSSDSSKIIGDNSIDPVADGQGERSVAR